MPVDDDDVKDEINRLEFDVSDEALAKTERERAERLYECIPAEVRNLISVETFVEISLAKEHRVWWHREWPTIATEFEKPGPVDYYQDLGERVLAPDKVGTEENPGTVVAYAHTCRRMAEIRATGHTPVMVEVWIRFPTALLTLPVPSGFCERSCGACFAQVIEMQDDWEAVAGSGSLDTEAMSIELSMLKQRVNDLEKRGREVPTTGTRRK